MFKSANISSKLLVVLEYLISGDNTPHSHIDFKTNTSRLSI